MNIRIKNLSAIFIALLFVFPSALMADNEMDKESEKTYEKIESQLIENYLAKVSEVVELNHQQQIIKAYNEKEQLEYKGSSDCLKGKKIIRSSDLLVETEEVKIYLTED